MHLDTDRVQRVLHGELHAHDEVAVREHLDSCPSCRARVTAAEQDERDVMRMLGALDHAPPTISAQRVLERARVAPRVPAAFRWAAGLLLAFGVTSVAYAIPGSPVRGWVDAVGLRLAGRVAVPLAPTVPITLVPKPAGPGATAGIAVAPGRALLIEFSSPVGAQVTVALTDEGAEVVVLAPPGAVSFTANAERLEIAINDSSARIDVRIPRTAARVEILVNGVRRYLKVAARITTTGVASAIDPYVITVEQGR